MGRRVGDADRASDPAVATLPDDPDALEEFYRRHVGAVAAFVARRVSQPDAVADIVSNTFLSAIRGAHTFDASRSPTTPRYWLLGIARREIANQQSADGRARMLAVRESNRRRPSDDELERIEELIDAQRLKPEIQAALDALAPPLREAFVLVAVDGIPQRDAASVLGISHGALRARLARARLQVRRHLELHPRPPAVRLNPQPTGGPDGL